jgi:hypothetical protein
MGIGGACERLIRECEATRSHVRGVALAPEQAVGEGRRQFAVQAEHDAVGREEDQAVVDRLVECGLSALQGC